MKFKGTIIITDPCYIIRAKHHGTIPMTNNDWDASKWGMNLSALGIHNYVSSHTQVGDWVCEVYDTDKNEQIGEFCADSGMVSVMLLDEVLNYNPKFDYHVNNPWATCMIKDFDGDVVIEDGDEIEGEVIPKVVKGTGNINFQSVFVGF